MFYLRCYARAWRNAFDASGRASRCEFLLCVAIAAVLTCVLFNFPHDSKGAVAMAERTAGWALTLSIVPLPSVAVRRLHDVGRTGGWVLMLFILVLGMLILPITWLTKGQPETNAYGPNPKTRYPDVPEEYLQDPVAAC